MQAIISGGKGFIGSHLAAELKNRGWKVKTFDIQDGQDVLNEKQVMDAVKGCDFVFHLAGKLGTHELVDDAVEASKVNILGTLNVLNACKKHGAKLVEVSKPNCWINTYTITKIAAEQFTEMYRREHGVEAITVKWFNVYGPGQKLNEEVGYKKFIPTAIVCALKGEPIEIYGNGEQTMDLVHTSDTVNATLSLAENWEKAEGGVYEIGSGHEVSVNDCAKEILKLTHSSSEIKHIPMRKGEWKDTHIKANLEAIGPFWTPNVSLETGLLNTIKYYKERYV